MSDEVKQDAPVEPTPEVAPLGETPVVPTTDLPDSGSTEPQGDVNSNPVA